MQRGSVFIGQDAETVLFCLAKVGGVGDFWEVKVLWEKINSVCIPSGCTGWYIAVVTAVVIEGGANVPTVNSMC